MASTMDMRRLGRAAEHAGDYGDDDAGGPSVNVGDVERIITGLGGLGLAVYGYRRGSMLGAGLAALGGMMCYRALTGHCSLYHATGLNTNSDRQSLSGLTNFAGRVGSGVAAGLSGAIASHRGSGPAAPEDYSRNSIHVEESITIQKSRDELYRFWRHFSNLPRFMDHLESVQVTGEGRSHWVAKAPAGTSVEWDAEIINEEDGRLIAWRSLGNADVDNAGSVRFLEASGGGTDVRVVIDYIPPAGRAGAAVAWLFRQAPGQQIRADLTRLKELMESPDAGDAPGQRSPTA